MGQIDTTLRYNGIYNSYEMGPNDTIHASIFETQYLSHVTTQFVAVRVAGTIVDGWIEAIWIDADGEQIGTTKTVTWTPTRLWKRYTHTFEVPTGAVKVKLTYRSGTAGYHFSCPMTEAGEIASAYNAQTAAQLAYHTAGGSYIGFLNANQIVAGVIRSLDGKMRIRLDEPSEIAMDGTAAKLRISPAYPLRVLDSANNVIAGLMLIEGETRFFTSALANSENPYSWFTVGSIEIEEDGNPVTLDGLFLFDEDSPAEPVYWFARDTWGWSGNLRIGNNENNIFIGYLPLGGISLYASGAMGNSHFDVHPDSITAYISPYGFVFSSDGDETKIMSGSNQALGVDSTGPYRIKNGKKTYW